MIVNGSHVPIAIIMVLSGLTYERSEMIIMHCFNQCVDLSLRSYTILAKKYNYCSRRTQETVKTAINSYHKVYSGSPRPFLPQKVFKKDMSPPLLPALHWGRLIIAFIV